MSWYEWKAAELNRIFGRDSRITPEIVKHGELNSPKPREKAKWLDQ